MVGAQEILCRLSERVLDFSDPSWPSLLCISFYPTHNMSSGPHTYTSLWHVLQWYEGQKCLWINQTCRNKAPWATWLLLSRPDLHFCLYFKLTYILTWYLLFLLPLHPPGFLTSVFSDLWFLIVCFLLLPPLPLSLRTILSCPVRLWWHGPSGVGLVCQL